MNETIKCLLQGCSDERSVGAIEVILNCFLELLVKSNKLNTQILRMFSCFKRVIKMKLMLLKNI